jgi:hypothetical protein
MKEYVHVKPREGLRIRDDFTSQIIPADGARVKHTRHIARRIQDGDLIEVESEPTKKSKKNESEG